MYQIETNPAFWAPVKVVLPGDENQLETFRAKFRVREVDDFNGYDFVTEEGLRSFLTDTIVDLDDIIGEDRKPVAFSNQLVKTLIAQPHLRGALFRAYNEAIVKAVVGN